MKKFAIALATFAVFGAAVGAAAPASAQGVVIGVNDGYRSGWWGGHSGYRSWSGGPRAQVYVDRPHVVVKRRHFRDYGAYGYGHRDWWGGRY
jgi:hypothetical protein